MKKITLNGKMYNLIDQTEYLNNKNYYDTESNVAIEHYNMALPLTQSQFSNGVYSTENRPIIKYNVPLDKDNYIKDFIISPFYIQRSTETFSFLFFML